MEFGRNYLVLWILIGLIIEAAAQDNFYFSPQPQDLDIIKGRSATLECGVSNSKHITFYWMLGADKVQNTTRRHQQGSNLYITRVDPQHDLGEFKCIATNVSTGISIESQAAQINILWISDIAKVNLVTQLSNLKVGGEMVLQCKVDGNPVVHVVWYRNGAKIFRNEYITLKNKRLHITGLRLDDNGIYSCRAVNDVGSVKSTLNYPLILKNDNVAQIVKLPKDQIIPVNGTVRFDCIYENSGAIEWYTKEEQKPLVNSSRITVYKNGSLLISDAQNGDEGLYHCTGISVSEDAPVQTYSAHLQLAYIEGLNQNNFEPRPIIDTMMVAPENGQFEVICIAPHGQPSPKIWWEDPEGTVVSDSGRIRVDDARLIIDAVKLNDAGNYTCIAQNAAGQTENSINLYVTVPPVVSSQHKELLIGEEESVTILCEFTSSPYPLTTVHWLKDKKYIRNSSSHYLFYSHNGTLSIRNVQLNDAGSYICEVNTTGFPPIQSTVVTLNVDEKLKFVPAPINKNLELNSVMKIYCKARGKTPPVVKWIKEGRRLFSWPPHVRDENGTLHFNTVQADDAGRYMCIATNSQGVINTTIQVDVIVMPKFIVQPTDTEAYEGYSAMIHCKASGDPLPTIQWDKNNILSGFDPNRFAVMENGTLYVSEIHPNDQGKYGCTAGNSGGFKRVEVSLIVKSSEDYALNHAEQGAEEETNTMTKTVMITLGAAAIYMTLVIGLMIWCRFRRARRKALMLAQTSAEVAKLEDGEVPPPNTEMKEKTRNGDIRDGNVCKSDGEVHSHSSGSHHSKRSRCSYDKLQFPQQDLQMMMLLGHGEYGEVYLSKARGIMEGEAETVVMVKMLQTRDENAHFEYKREMEIFHKLNHCNITKLLGICRDSDPFMMILEYSDWGDLKQFLLATNKDHSTTAPKPSPLAVAEMIGLCHQIALGMENLSNHRFTHKDLAARNCLISSKFHIKISCVGLSQDTYSQEYYLYHNRTIPLRWAPAEAILEDEWSTKSDVWSFAVLVWEVFNQAETPFSDKSDEKVLQMLKKHQLQWQPPNSAPEALCTLLNQCWSRSPKDRPSFSEIVLQMDNHITDSKV